MQRAFILVVCLFLTKYFVVALEDAPKERGEKLISTFQIVRFPNDVCVGSNSRNGTCYTSAECSDKDGTSSGSCADGFGVCCTFVISTCGSSASENITYWTSPSSVSSGTCKLTVCPMSDDICSIRLDLTTFVITGPSTRTVAEINRRFGQTAGVFDTATGTNSIEYIGSTQATTCQADIFTVQGASPSSTPPAVCGTLTGQHMYVEADADRCNAFTFSLAASAPAVTLTNSFGIATLASRSWDITATQIECTSLTLPPPGCTQYFWSSPTAATYTLKSANLLTSGTSTHLGNQHDRFCFRRERGKCTGCFYTSAANFAVSGVPVAGEIEIAQHHTAPGGCCGYGTTIGSLFGALLAEQKNEQGLGGLTADDEAFNYGFDCIIIPGAMGAVQIANEGAPQATQTATTKAQILKDSTNMPQPWPPQICGNLAGIGIGATLIEEATMGVGMYVDETDSPASEYGDEENLTVCTKATPFVLEFMSDDLEGIGGESTAREYAQITTNRGFQLYHNQIDCA